MNTIQEQKITESIVKLTKSSDEIITKLNNLTALSKLTDIDTKLSGIDTKLNSINSSISTILNRTIIAALLYANYEEQTSETAKQAVKATEYLLQELK